jgi:hypothetical protein
MKTEIAIQVRAFPVIVEELRSNERSEDTIILTKEQLQAAQMVGQSSNELIYRLYNRQGFKVLHIIKPFKKTITINLEDLLMVHDVRKLEKECVSDE